MVFLFIRSKLVTNTFNWSGTKVIYILQLRCMWLSLLSHETSDQLECYWCFCFGCMCYSLCITAIICQHIAIIRRQYPGQYILWIRHDSYCVFNRKPHLVAWVQKTSSSAGSIVSFYSRDAHINIQTFFFSFSDLAGDSIIDPYCICVLP